MTAEETKAAESGAQSAPLPLEGVDISPKQDEGVLKVRGGGLPGVAGGAKSPSPPRSSGRPGLGARTAASAASRPAVDRGVQPWPGAPPCWPGRQFGAGGRPHARKEEVWAEGSPVPQPRSPAPRPGSAAPAPAAACAGRGAPGGRAREPRGDRAACTTPLCDPGPRGRLLPCRRRRRRGAPPAACASGVRSSPTLAVKH